jgi:dipeptidyl aminopeptidase/acylaminoacyl peptidase
MFTTISLLLSDVCGFSASRWWFLRCSHQFNCSPKGKGRPMEYLTFYRTIHVDEHTIFYREAGPKEAPTLLLLHGPPSSSRMFDPLFARLSDRYHLVAPDYPGFGHSDLA